MIQRKVNGADQSFNGDPDRPQVWYLGDVLALTGSKFGRGIGLCGACMVHVDGQASHTILCLHLSQKIAIEGEAMKQDSAEHHVIFAFKVLLLFFVGFALFVASIVRASPVPDSAPSRFVESRKAGAVLRT